MTYVEYCLMTWRPFFQSGNGITPPRRLASKNNLNMPFFFSTMERAKERIPLYQFFINNKRSMCMCIKKEACPGYSEVSKRSNRIHVCGLLLLLVRVLRNDKMKNSDLRRKACVCVLCSIPPTARLRWIFDIFTLPSSIVVDYSSSFCVGNEGVHVEYTII
jgi:hypothetical protein